VQGIREHLRAHGSKEHARGVQWFFKEEVRSHGWYTGDLRRYAAAQRRGIGSPEVLLRVADRLFRGRVLEEKIVAVMLLEKSVAAYGERKFKVFEGWLDRVSSWADHDALAYYLLGPLIAADLSRAQRVFVWARSRNRWRRRASAVALIRAARTGAACDEITRISRMLLTDEDDMVQKGLGWLLRESVKANREGTVPLLISIRDRAPRLVLRTACETLAASERQRVMGKRK
jgi:3-methyladenine DNA glycosylase AlkD